MKFTKLFSFVLTAALLASLFVLGVSAEEPTGTPISSAADFAAMDLKGSYYLAADITLNNSYSKPFTGTFDGNGHTVTLGGSPMFTDFCGTIRNLTIEGSVKCPADAGAIASNSSLGFVAKNVVNNASVNGSNNVGGFVGSAHSVELSYCINNGAVTGSSASAEVGGFLGHPANSAGTSDVIIRVCQNNGAITSPYDAAGFVGYLGLKDNLPTNGGAYLIEKCANTGVITGSRYAGGFVAYCYASSTNAYVVLRYGVNSGKIIGGRSSSGFVSEFIAYTNSAATTINFCVGCGELVLAPGASKSSTYFCIMGCSSADTTKCSIRGVYLVDNGMTEYYSYATSNDNAANRHVIASMFGNERITRSTAAELADGTVLKGLNYTSASDAFIDDNGIPMPKALVYAFNPPAEPEVSTEEETTAAPVVTEAPTEAPTDPVEEKGCKSVAGSAAVLVVLLGTAIVSKKREIF